MKGAGAMKAGKTGKVLRPFLAGAIILALVLAAGMMLAPDKVEFHAGEYVITKAGRDRGLVFSEDGTCVLHLVEPLSSFFLGGNYTLEGDELVCQCGSFTYAFRVEGERALRYLAAASEPCRDRYCVQLDDGDTFQRLK